MKSFLVALVAVGNLHLAQAFVAPHALTTPSTTTVATATSSSLRMLDPMAAMDGVAAATTIVNNWASTMPAAAENIMSSSNLLSFTDQGQNLAGIFFQASLLPYLLFLYFLSFRGNRIPALSNFGFQFVLLFVISTIPSGIISKSVYGETLANVDYLHGGAELLLTMANIFIVLGLKQAMTNPEPPSPNTPRNVGLGLAAGFAGCLALLPGIIGDPHAPFLFGIGNINPEFIDNLRWVIHNEPSNGLSIPTWAIHFSSVFEYLFAMGLVWEFAKTTKCEQYKGLTFGMLPLHASGICACTYHFFYNDPSLQFLVTSQAGLTLLGNITCMIAAFRIARANGWTVEEINPFPASSTSPRGLVADGFASMPLELKEESESTVILAGKLAAATLVASYLVKYGELAIDLPFTPNPYVATAAIVGIPAVTAYNFYQKDEGGLALPSFLTNEDGDGPSLSMADVKKFGVAGTVAYVLTELAFWLVAFPVAATALYQSTGHWPDVINDGGDRTAVLAFIFAGANIARAFVPIRLGAALALAPWVDENLLNREGTEETP